LALLRAANGLVEENGADSDADANADSTTTTPAAATTTMVAFAGHGSVRP
jgi:hypothetical protein